MKTLIKDRRLGLLTFVTRQYECGLYVAVYSSGKCIEQMNLSDTEQELHDKLRQLPGYVKEDTL